MSFCKNEDDIITKQFSDNQITEIKTIGPKTKQSFLGIKIPNIEKLSNHFWLNHVSKTDGNQ